MLDIKYKPTPTKIIPVCSQEVRDDDDVDEDEMQVDTEGGDSQSDSGDTTSPASNHDKGKRPMNPNKVESYYALLILTNLSSTGMPSLRKRAQLLPRFFIDSLIDLIDSYLVNLFSRYTIGCFFIPP